MGRVRKFLIISFIVILSFLFSLAVSFFISPRPTISFFKMTNINKDYVNRKSETFLNLDYEVEKDLIYDSEYKNNYFDIYRPKDIDQDLVPTILWVHGGTYVSGDKSNLETFLPFFANKGYVVISINYELAPSAKFPTPVKQIVDAFNYIDENSKILNVDTNNFFVGGDSVGAEMAAQFINTQYNNKYSNLLNLGSSNSNINIKGAILYFGTFELESLGKIKELSKLFYDRMKWSYLGTRKWEESEVGKKHNFVNNINTFPPAYITDISNYEFEQTGIKLSNKLENEKSFFPNQKYNLRLPFEYQFYLEGYKSDIEVKKIALENFNNTIDFINSKISN